jgi:hypothetical protein
MRSKQGGDAMLLLLRKGYARPSAFCYAAALRLLRKPKAVKQSKQSCMLASLLAKQSGEASKPEV